MKNVGQTIIAIMFGFIVGCLVTFAALDARSTPASDDAEMTKFLVSLYRGQAVPWEDLPLGVYRVGPSIDNYTRVLIQVVPLGDIPLLVSDVPALFIENTGIIQKTDPVIERDW